MSRCNPDLEKVTRKVILRVIQHVLQILCFIDLCPKIRSTLWFAISASHDITYNGLGNFTKMTIIKALSIIVTIKRGLFYFFLKSIIPKSYFGLMIISISTKRKTVATINTRKKIGLSFPKFESLLNNSDFLKC